jgi:ferredoxin
MSTDPLVTLVVDDDLCVGIGRCEQLEPEAIQVQEDGLAHPTPVQLLRARAQELCDQCPAAAISIAEPADAR